MDPSVKFVSPHRDLISKKKLGSFFSEKKTYPGVVNFHLILEFKVAYAITQRPSKVFWKEVLNISNCISLNECQKQLH